MDSIDNKIRAILKAQIIDDEDKEFLNIDFTLEQQNAELAAKGQTMVDGPNEFKPKLGASITYIVAAIIMNESNETLMIQEANPRCAGSWYLPAGRVEPGETLQQAIKREVLEESGLVFEPSTLLKVESSLGTWYRFLFAGHVTGGTLKTVAQADQESLQACYVADVSKLSLRSKDCLSLIELGREYLRGHDDWFTPQLVTKRVVPNIFLRLLIGGIDAKNKSYNVLISTLLSPHLPLCEINPTRSVHATLKRFMQHIFGADRLPQHRPYGLLVMEHDGSCAESALVDGLCLTLLVMCKDSIDNVSLRSGFSWKLLDKQLEALLLSKLASKHKTIHFSVL